MKEEKERQRFFKPYHFLNERDNPGLCLKEIFQTYSLEDIKDELTLWEKLALVNTQGAYEEGGEREDVMDFCYDLSKLVEVMYIVHEAINRKERTKFIKGLSKEAKKIIKDMNKQELISEREKANPLLVIKHFCKRFTRTYAKAEILDLLSVAVSYEGELRIYKSQLTIFYQCLKYMVTFSFMVNKNKKLLLNPK